MYAIPVLAADSEAEDIVPALQDVLPEGVSLSTPRQPDSVDLAPAIVMLLIPAAKEVLIAAISAIGTIWAAKIAAEAARKATQPKPANEPERVALLELDTFSDSYLLVADKDLESRLREVLPANVKVVQRIRLRSDKSV